MAILFGAGGVPARAADPTVVSAGAEHLAAGNGGVTADYELVYERSVAFADGTGGWAGKYVDRRDGAVHIVYRTVDGAFGGPEVLEAVAEAAAARTAIFEQKTSPELRASIAAGGDAAAAGIDGVATPTVSGTLPLAVWLNVDAAQLDTAVAAVVARHPNVTWLANRPLVDDLESMRVVRGELYEAQAAVYAQAAEQLRAHVEALGGSLGYASTSAPLAFVDLPVDSVPALSAEPSVRSLGLEGTWGETMTSAGPAVDANWTSGTGDQGNGVRVAVVEYHNVRETGDLAGKVVESFSASGTLAYTAGGQFDHPTWVAGAVASNDASWRGTAPGAHIVSASTGGGNRSLATDRKVIAAADWAVRPSGGDADVTNTSLIADSTAGAEEMRRYFDAIGWEHGRLPVSSAGNYATSVTWNVGSPGTAYNVLTIGGNDDKGSAGRADDRHWYVPGSNGSSYHDPAGGPFNAHGDYNKPNISAPAVSVVTANGLGATGTSASTPIVAGIAAQIISRAPALAAWPEATRAILTAGAIYHTRMPDGSVNRDHEGAGSASAEWANRILVAGDGQYGGYRIGTMTSPAVVVQNVSVIAGQKVRVALAWSSHTSGSDVLEKSDVLTADLDLRIVQPDGSTTGSYTIDNSYEFVELKAKGSGTLRLEIRAPRFNSSSEPFALAWVKWGGDSSVPVVTRHSPYPGDAWAPRTARIRATFSERISGLWTDSFQVRRDGQSSAVPAALTWDLSRLTATLTPNQPLDAGVYDVMLTSKIKDVVGNALPPTSWSFTVIGTALTVDQPLSPDRRVDFDGGGHFGHRFDANGRVTGTLRATLSRDSGSWTDERATIPGQPGVWLHITAGIWEGYWVRESGRAGIDGRYATVAFAPERRIVVAAGSHTGYDFSSSGVVEGTKKSSVSRNSGAHVSRRAVINGATYLFVVDGIWAGYWLRESGVVYLPGALDFRSLRTDSRATFASGTYWGFQTLANGDVRSTKAGTLSQTSGAPVDAWAVVNGRPSLSVTLGLWMGYWVPESTRVRSP